MLIALLAVLGVDLIGGHTVNQGRQGRNPIRQGGDR
jgi:hypothetical protein